MKIAALALLVAAATLAGCGAPGARDDQEFPDLPAGAVVRRRGTVVVEGCTLDGWQRETLASEAAKQVLSEVVLLCLAVRSDGSVSPTDDTARTELTNLVASLQGDGYRVGLGATIGEDALTPYGPDATTKLLRTDDFRNGFAGKIAPFAPFADAIDLALPTTTADANDDVGPIVAALSALVGPGALDVFVPPSTTDPSDLPGGDAYALEFLTPYVNRVRLMTLDYAIDDPPGPTLDSGWAIDVYRNAIARARPAAIDVSVPLYGTDWSDLGPRSVSFLEATSLASAYRAPIVRGPTGAPHVAYTDGEGHAHDAWFDDATSTLLVLSAWDPTVLPSAVGVVYYGLGDEDPALWRAIAESAR